MKKIYIIPFILLVLASCVKDNLYKTPHPDTGAVVVTTNYSRTSPADYTLRIGSIEQTVTGTTNLFKDLLPPAEYTLLAYNTPEGITVSNTTATVNTIDGGYLHSSFDHLYSGTQQITVPADDTLRVTQKMRQLSRTLVLRLNLSASDAKRILSVEATLSGIARNTDISSGIIDTTTSGTVIPEFRLLSETAADTTQWYLQATIILLGIADGSPQNLNLKVTLDTGHEETIEDDISDALDDFNDKSGGDGSSGGDDGGSGGDDGGSGGDDGGSGGDNGGGDTPTPVEIDAELRLPVEAGSTATISDWTNVDNGNINIH